MRVLASLLVCLSMAPAVPFAQTVTYKGRDGIAILTEDNSPKAADRCAVGVTPVSLDLALGRYTEAFLSVEFFAPIKSSILVRRGSHTHRTPIPTVNASGHMIKPQTPFVFDRSGFSATLAGCLSGRHLTIAGGQIEIDMKTEAYEIAFRESLDRLADMAGTPFFINYETSVFENAGSNATMPRYPHYTSFKGTEFEGIAPLGRLAMSLREYRMRFASTVEDKPELNGALKLQTGFFVFDGRPQSTDE